MAIGIRALNTEPGPKDEWSLADTDIKQLLEKRPTITTQKTSDFSTTAGTALSHISEIAGSGTYGSSTGASDQGTVETADAKNLARPRSAEALRGASVRLQVPGVASQEALIPQTPGAAPSRALSPRPRAAARAAWATSSGSDAEAGSRGVASESFGGGSGKKKGLRAFRAQAKSVQAIVRAQLICDEGLPRTADVAGLVQRIAVTLTSMDTYRSVATRVFENFCLPAKGLDGKVEQSLPTSRVADILAHWHIPEVHLAMFWALLRKHLPESDSQVLPSSLDLETFLAVFIKLLRRVRDKYCEMKVGKDQFVTQNSKRLEEEYQVAESCGSGNFGECSWVTHRKSKQRRVCKKIAVNTQVPSEEIGNELDVLKKLDHPNVVRVFEWFEAEEAFFLVMEAANGGDLRRFLAASQQEDGKAGLGETMTRHLVIQAMRAVAYIHSQRVMHLDIKPANMLLAAADADQPHLLLADFGLAELFDSQAKLGAVGVKGSAAYMAPEAFGGSISPGCDVWALGVVTYELLCGKRPFRGVDNMAAMYAMVRRAEVSYDIVREAGAGDEVVAFITTLLCKDVEKRPTAATALKDVWMQPAETDVALNCRQARKMRKALTNYATMSSFAKVALNCVVSQLDSGQIESLAKTFQAFDEDGDGQLSHAELVAGLAKLGVDEHMATELTSVLDVNGDGVIQYSELVSGMLQAEESLAENHMRNAFDVFDVDRNGFVSLDELRLMLTGGGPLAGVLPDGKTPEQVLEEVDTSKDGNISFLEFKAYVMQQAAGHRPSVTAAAPVVKELPADIEEDLTEVLRRLAKAVGREEEDCVSHGRRLAKEHWIRTVSDLLQLAPSDWWRLGLPLKLECMLKAYCGINIGPVYPPALLSHGGSAGFSSHASSTHSLRMPFM
mmetsp:Transcript_43154/g.101405  ORF Transcript_43154/g.101405 Transcript_43154/m.101405 type:complete len:898 (-) Transcript_43154:155-2848(-)|eukprot:CAMPEP_0178392700 /NCGR_PEP_ID=MMETSP0689_2-20121128/11811_1 /TAXON_ID=160604 /ORGANISM="Amphidinium massartii, Strain CS-259" /LENGTH=897 /DNA_ID=CAMNT_0020013277 /DNA_START=56 /DNA_END=2749 /DNA_ORIENTATION=-